MAKVVIKKRRDAPEHSNGLRFSDYDTTIDGVEISCLTELKLNLSTDGFNECTMTFFVDDIEVDADFVAAVEAHVKIKKDAAEEKTVTSGTWGKSAWREQEKNHCHDEG